jgi:hypothetical protein
MSNYQNYDWVFWTVLVSIIILLCLPLFLHNRISFRKFKIKLPQVKKLSHNEALTKIIIWQEICNKLNSLTASPEKAIPIIKEALQTHEIHFIEIKGPNATTKPYVRIIRIILEKGKKEVKYKFDKIWSVTF